MSVKINKNQSIDRLATCPNSSSNGNKKDFNQRCSFTYFIGLNCFDVYAILYWDQLIGLTQCSLQIVKNKSFVYTDNA